MGIDMTATLKAIGIGKRFGALAVLEGIDFDLSSSAAIGIVGPNGAGKSTLMAVLSGALVPSAGRIEMDGRDITELGAAERSGLGVMRTHQIPKPFLGLTVLENVLVGATHAGAAQGEAAYALALGALDTAGMRRLANRPAESLGLLDRKRLELARALATRPKILLLDEIGGGLTDAEAEELVQMIKGLRAEGIGIVWIEHIVHLLMQVVERLICVDAGRIIADGSPAAVMAHPDVVRAYMGGV
ncbi:ATP-binding cassette domain-containing protein [bacterium]|nr:ATP-binding cassette domain-containing protein [bacterium]